MTARRDAGLADPYWRQYFTPEEVAELEAAIWTTGLVYENTPLHVRVYEAGPDARTIVAPHGLIVYGFLCARLHLEFHRAGWNVVSWDLPGFGQSGGTRNGPNIGSMIAVWRKMIDWAAELYDGRVYMVGLAEDGVTGYYAAANNPNVEAISVHHLVEFGDLDNVAWVNPLWKRRLQGLGLAVLEKIAPWAQFDAEKSVPWEAIFSSDEDQEAYALYRKDPLRIERYNVHLARDLFRRRKPPVSFEDCRTPVQMISSDLNKIWPARINDKTFARLGCEKELVHMNADQWSVSQEFNAEYAGLVLSWFDRVGDREAEVVA